MRSHPRTDLFSTDPTFRGDLPVYDLVVTLTGLDMARIKKGKMSRSNTGYAYGVFSWLQFIFLKH